MWYMYVDVVNDVLFMCCMQLDIPKDIHKLMGGFVVVPRVARATTRFFLINVKKIVFY